MSRRLTVGIIGAGAGGIAMAIQLADGGYEFTIFDRADGFGGTWRHNTFPGAACDVPSHLYSYSFAPNPRWSKTYANQPEILAYLERVAAGHGLGAHLRPGTTISTVRWSDERRRWTLTADDGREHHVDVVVCAVGMLDVPHIPDIPGAERFRGRRFHDRNRSSWCIVFPLLQRLRAAPRTGSLVERWTGARYESARLAPPAWKPARSTE